MRGRIKDRSYKLTVPHAQAHIPRPALARTLTQAHRRTPLTWVTGLPGSGKTSLVARWCREGTRRTVWYRVDADDADAAAYLDALSRAVGPRRRLPSWSPENQGDLLDFARSFFSGLAKTPLTLVLDDCHRVADDAPLLAVFSVLHEVCGAKLRAVMISRRHPPALLAGAGATGALELVDEMRLSAREVERLAKASGVRRPSLEQRLALRGADGWLARVLAICRAASSTRLVEQPADEVGDFLAAELLSSVPATQRASLRRLAELPEVPTTRAGAWLSPEADRLLASLSSQRYFVERTGDRYRLHDLLRDALLRQNAIEDTPEQLNATRRALADWIEPAMPEAAMHLCSTAKDTEGALRMLRAHGVSWLGRGLHLTVTGWLAALPAAADASAGSELAYWRAQALLPLQPELARPLFAAARAAHQTSADTERAYAAWCGQVDSYVIQWGAVVGLADLVDELEAMERTLGPPKEPLRTSAAALTALMYGRAEDPRTAHFAERTARAVTHAPDAGARISAAAQLLIYRMWWAGDFPGGRALYETFDAEVDEGAHLDALPRLLWWSCAAIVDWQCGSPATCYQKVDRGLKLAATSGVHVRDFFLLTQGIFCALSQEDWPRAESYLSRLARTEREHRRLDVMVHHFFRSWYSLSRGDARTSRAHAEAAWSVAESIGSTFHKVIALSALGPSLVHTGELDGAEKAYREQINLAKASGNPTFSFIAFCAGAELALARGDEVALAKQVERMLMVKHLGGFHSTCGWRTSMMRQVLSFALERGIHPETARQWIRERRIAPPERPVPGWPRPVTIETGGGLFVKLDAKDPEPKAKSPHKLRQLLAVLVAARRGASQGELTDWLWPDSDGDRAAAALKVAVHRLRQWLGPEAVRVENGRVSLDEAIVDCDLWSVGRRPGTRVLEGFDTPPVRALRVELGHE